LQTNSINCILTIHSPLYDLAHENGEALSSLLGLLEPTDSVSQRGCASHRTVGFIQDPERDEHPEYVKEDQIYPAVRNVSWSERVEQQLRDLQIHDVAGVKVWRATQPLGAECHESYTSSVDA
jgi:hypothetical protein